MWQRVIPFYLLLLTSPQCLAPRTLCSPPGVCICRWPTNWLWNIERNDHRFWYFKATRWRYLTLVMQVCDFGQISKSWQSFAFSSSVCRQSAAHSGASSPLPFELLLFHKMVSPGRCSNWFRYLMLKMLHLDASSAIALIYYGSNSVVWWIINERNTQLPFVRTKTKTEWGTGCRFVRDVLTVSSPIELMLLMSYNKMSL